jgi:CrcB protein
MIGLNLMYVACGGAVGAMARYGLSELVARLNQTGFPYGTLVVNVLGSLLMGVWIAIIATQMPARTKDLHLLLAVGFLGGFTTFSAFSMDAFTLMERGLHAQAFFYVFGSVLLSVLALVGGMWLVKALAA